MPCYHPIRGFRNEQGKIKPVGETIGDLVYNDIPLSVPCGRCRGCRKERTRQWAVRMMHHAQHHKVNAFLTLTYDDDHLPSDGSLKPRDFTLYMKRLRKRLGPSHRVSYFHCGEYGTQTERPHYHCALFGYDYRDDWKLWSRNSGNPLYTSDQADQDWKQGGVYIGRLTMDSAAYIAKYCQKKITGPKAEEHYQRVNTETGELYQLQPEYATMSRNPAIGKTWYEQFRDDVYPHDYVVINGVECKPPRYYDRLLQDQDPETYERIKQQRQEDNARRDNSPTKLKRYERVDIKKERALTTHTAKI